MENGRVSTGEKDAAKKLSDPSQEIASKAVLSKKIVTALTTSGTTFTVQDVPPLEFVLLSNIKLW